MLRTLLTFVTFYFIAAPIAGLVALTDVVTTSVSIKLATCVGATSIAQFMQAVLNFVYLHRLDWDGAGMLINDRANTDRRQAPLDGASSTPELIDPLAATSLQEWNEPAS